MVIQQTHLIRTLCVRTMSGSFRYGLEPMNKCTRCPCQWVAHSIRRRGDRVSVVGIGFAHHCRNHLPSHHRTSSLHNTNSQTDSTQTNQTPCWWLVLQSLLYRRTAKGVWVAVRVYGACDSGVDKLLPKCVFIQWSARRTGRYCRQIGNIHKRMGHSRANDDVYARHLCWCTFACVFVFGEGTRDWALAAMLFATDTFRWVAVATGRYVSVGFVGRWSAPNDIPFTNIYSGRNKCGSILRSTRRALSMVMFTD